MNKLRLHSKQLEMINIILHNSSLFIKILNDTRWIGSSLVKLLEIIRDGKDINNYYGTTDTNISNLRACKSHMNEIRKSYLRHVKKTDGFQDINRTFTTNERVVSTRIDCSYALQGVEQ